MLIPSSASVFSGLSAAGWHAVDWHEGMLLMPQHLQQQDEREDRLRAYHTQMLHPFHTGVVHMEIDETALREGMVVFQALEVVFPQGDIYRMMTPSHGLPPLDLKPWAAAVTKKPHRVCLEMQRTASGEALFQTYAEEACDRRTQDNPILVPRRVPQAVLKLYLEKPIAALGCVPLVEIVCDTGVFRLTAYQPPQVWIHPQSFLGCRVKEVLSRVRHTIISHHQQSEGGQGKQRNLQSLWAALVPLELLMASGTVSSWHVFMALATLAGHAATWGTVCPIFEGFNPWETGRSFEQLLTFITQTIAAVPVPYDTLVLTAVAGGWVLPVVPSECHEVILGIESSEVTEEADLIVWAHNVFVASASLIEHAVSSRTCGMKRTLVSRMASLPGAGSRFFVRLTVADPFFCAGEPLYVMHATSGFRPPRLLSYTISR